MSVKLKGIVLPSSLTYPKLDSFSLFSVMSEVPVTDGLVGSYFVGSRNADPRYNFANPSLPLIPYMSPDYTDPKFALLSVGRGYFDTQIAPTTTQTIVAIAKVPAATGVIASNYYKDSSNQISGDAFLENISTAKSLRYYAQSSTNGTTQASRDISALNIGDFSVVGGKITADPTVGAWTMSDSADPGVSSATMAARVLNSRTLRIGASYAANEFNGDIGIAAVLIYNTDIGGPNMTTVMNWMRNVVGVQAGIWSAPKG
ncbi:MULTISPECIES: hypothetical protein [Klebsiella]|uniref:hypothetical protein n=1 Tax=Klebsiella TaxID=570 RepID=UPI0022439AE3|nr:hypothetical protein [Klebsiella grimontii]